MKKKKCFVHQDGDSIRSSSTLHIEVSLGIIQKPKIALVSLVCVWQKMNSMFSFVWLWLVEERNIWVSDETRENATQIPSVYLTWHALYSAAIVRITHLDKLQFFVIFFKFSPTLWFVSVYILIACSALEGVLNNEREITSKRLTHQLWIIMKQWGSTLFSFPFTATVLEIRKEHVEWFHYVFVSLAVFHCHF